MSIINSFSTTDPAIAERHGACWNCVGSRDVEKGTLYLYQLRPDAPTKKREIFPAIEPGSYEQVFDNPILKSLGYEHKRERTGIYLTLPDSKLITARFETLLNDQNLRPLKIMDCEDVGDKQFIGFYLSDIDVIVSKKDKCVHDHFAHLIPHVLASTQNPTQFYHERDRLRKMVRGAYDRIQHVENKMAKGIQVISDKELIKIKAFVALFVDIIWSEPSVQGLQFHPSDSFTTSPYHFITTLQALKSYQRYWSKTFPSSSIEAMRSVWHTIMTFDL